MQVTTGEEQETAKRICERIDGVRIILPMRELSEKSGGKWRTVTRVMLTGYLFIRLDELRDAATIWHGVRRTDGVLRILGEMLPPDMERLTALANRLTAAVLTEKSQPVQGDGRAPVHL